MNAWHRAISSVLLMSLLTLGCGTVAPTAPRVPFTVTPIALVATNTSVPPAVTPPPADTNARSAHSNGHPSDEQGSTARSGHPRRYLDPPNRRHGHGLRARWHVPDGQQSGTDRGCTRPVRSVCHQWPVPQSSV